MRSLEFKFLHPDQGFTSVRPDELTKSSAEGWSIVHLVWDGKNIKTALMYKPVKKLRKPNAN